MPPDEINDTMAFEDALAGSSQDHYVLRLYVTGSTPRSLRAIQNLRDMCEVNLKGRYEFEIIDIYQQPEQTEIGNVVVTPTLIKSLPPPSRTVIGDLSNMDRVLISLDIIPVHKADAGGEE